MELVQLQRLIAILRDNGITSYKDGDLELTLGAAPVQSTGRESDSDELASKAESSINALPGAYGQIFSARAK